ncbi:MAG: ATPase [Treponema sp.]|nr:ATPase [Treponema sp.]MBR4005940.1 ATPase [Treponema sp.]
MKGSFKRRFFIIAVLMAVVSVSAVSAQSASDQTAAVQEQSQDGGSSSAIKYLAAALAVGIACVGGGMAVGKIGAAAMGAMSENAELSGKALPFVGLAEGICLWGFLVALFIILM